MDFSRALASFKLLMPAFEFRTQSGDGFVSAVEFIAADMLQNLIAGQAVEAVTGSVNEHADVIVFPALLLAVIAKFIAASQAFGWIILPLLAGIADMGFA